MNTCLLLGSEILEKVWSTSTETPVAFEIATRSTGSALADWALLGSEEDGARGEDMAATLDEDGTCDNYQ